MSRNFLPELKHNNYYEAFNIYADLSDKFLTQAKTDKPYDKVNNTAKPRETSSSSGGGSSTHTSSSGRTHGGTGVKF